MISGAKTLLAARYQRLRAGFESHRDLFTPGILPLLRMEELITAGDAFAAAHAAEIAARPQVSPLSAARAAAEMELRIAYNRVKNLLEARIGEHDTAQIDRVIGRGSLLTRALYTQTALTADPAFAALAGEHEVAELTREIREYQDAARAYADTREAAEAADDTTDAAADELVLLLRRTQLYIAAYLEDIQRTDLMPSFVQPRVVHPKASAAVPAAV